MWQVDLRTDYTLLELTFDDLEDAAAFISTLTAHANVEVEFKIKKVKGETE